MGTTFDLKGKVAIVTGGGRGIGKEIVLGLARSGAKVVIGARKKEEIETAAKEVVAAGGEAVAVPTDLTVNEQLENLVKAAVDNFGTVDILVNNAARSFFRPLFELREDGWDKIFDTNVKATFLLSRTAAGIMKEKGGGRIVNITTVAAERGGVGMGVYHSSKAAVKMLTMCMASEWAPYNINVNAVGPGMTRTPFSQPIWSNPDLEQGILQGIPKGRIAEPEEIVGAVLFLCSDASNFITGTSIYVDGGSLAM